MVEHKTQIEEMLRSKIAAWFPSRLVRVEPLGSFGFFCEACYLAQFGVKTFLMVFTLFSLIDVFDK